jgi:hypothetical protein
MKTFKITTANSPDPIIVQADSEEEALQSVLELLIDTYGDIEEIVE